MVPLIQFSKVILASAMDDTEAENLKNAVGGTST
jgi:hypothetical protein